MNEKQKKKIDALIKFLKREPKKRDLLAEVLVGRMAFENRDLYKKYQMIDKHIKLIVKCLDEEYITYNYFF